MMTVTTKRQSHHRKNEAVRVPEVTRDLTRRRKSLILTFIGEPHFLPWKMSKAILYRFVLTTDFSQGSWMTSTDELLSTGIEPLVVPIAEGFEMMVGAGAAPRE